jgi:uncharacterized protein YggE
MKVFAAIFLVLFSSFAAFSEPELRGNPTELTQYLKDIPKTVSVVGTSEVKVQADRAVVSLSVRTEDKLLATALRNNQKLRGEISASLEKHGIKGDQIKASRFSQTPKYGLFGDKAKSYVVENTIKVTVQNEKDFQAAASVVDGVNEARYLSVEYEQADKLVHQKKALEEACDKATEKKQLLESKFGFKLVAQKISEGVKMTPTEPASRRYGSYGPRGDSSFASKSNSDVALETGDDGGTAFGELVYTAEVTVEYRVEK